MLPEIDGDTTNGRYRIDHCKSYSFHDDDNYDDNEYPMKINSFSFHRDDSTTNMNFPIDQNLFIKKYSDCDEETEEGAQINRNNKDLVHIIQILHGPNKKKEIKVEEVFEIAKKVKSVKKPRAEPKKEKTDESSKENRLCSASGVPTSKVAKKTREKMPATSKSHPNSQINQEKKCNRLKNERSRQKEPAENIYHSQTEAPANFQKKMRRSSERIRPYMLDTKSRREVKDYEHYLNRKGNLPSYPPVWNPKTNSKSKKNGFEVKYVSSGFVRTSDLSIPETCDYSYASSKTSVDMEKYQTEPKVKNTSFFVSDKGRSSPKTQKKSEKIENTDNTERELYEFFEEYPNLMSSNRKSSKSFSIFDKLKGDERDLPGIYSRFVRRSKGVFAKNPDDGTRSFCSTNDINDAKNSSIFVNDELEDHMEGELIKDPPKNEKLLELINKNPFRLEEKCRELTKNKRAPRKKEGVQDITKQVQEKKEENTTYKKKKVKSSTNTKTLETKKSKDSESTQNSKKIIKRKNSKKISKGNQISVEITNHAHQRKITPAVLNHDPIKENLNMSPTTAINMMVLAADKVLADKTDFFGKTSRKVKNSSGVRATNCN